MAITVSQTAREFLYNGMIFVDPGATFSPDDVRDLYSAQYPELTTASVDGPEVTDGVLRYKFVRAAGAKGSDA